MTNQRSTSSTENNSNLGGLFVNWYLGDDPKTITTKAGETRTIIELRDPRRLSNSVSIWLDGDSESFSGVAPGSIISLQLESVRAGRGRGELTATVSRETVESAFSQARQK